MIDKANRLFVVALVCLGIGYFAGGTVAQGQIRPRERVEAFGGIDDLKKAMAEMAKEVKAMRENIKMLSAAPEAMEAAAAVLKKARDR